MSALPKPRWISAGLPVLALVCFAPAATAADEEFLALTRRLEVATPTFAKRQQDMLAERYDLVAVRADEAHHRDVNHGFSDALT